MIVTAGKTNVSVYFYIVQDASGTSPGEAKTGLLFSDIETGGSASYMRQGAARTDFTLVTLASASAAHTDGGFILVDDTNLPGVYRCDVPDLAFATGADEVTVGLVVAAANNAAVSPLKVQILDVDLRDATSAGISRIDAAVTTRLAPTTAARTLDVTAGGTAGIDWANVEAPTTALDLSGTDIQLCDTVTTLTGHTAQTGDSFARLGAPAAASVSADLLAIDNFVDDLETRIPATLTLPGQVAPPLAPTLEEAIGWLYKVLRNRTTQTATQWSLLADNESTVDAKATVSDDATTAIVQEIVTGP